jgi:CDP-6-deoxy-D-xylo-4-hexulose-3-dehydrase
MLLEAHSRINEAKPVKYWYPLSMASYGVEEILEALDSMCSFRTSMWEKTAEFERSFAKYQNCSDAVMVNSGSSADLLLSFLLTGPPSPKLERGDEILIPAVTWPTQVWSPMMAGLKVRLVDIDPDTLNISLGDLEWKITPSSRAIFLVHLLGNPCDMGGILELARTHNLIVIEDCCEALGSEWNGVKVGNFGLGAAFSFFFSHHITTMEGGMITTNDPDLADRLRILRAHGWLRNVDPSRCPVSDDETDARYSFVNWGFNLRPTELQAGFGLQQLAKLPEFTERRGKLASRFFSYIDGSRFLSRPAVSASGRPIWMALPVLLKECAPFRRHDITAYLERSGVETRPIVAGNLTRQPAARLFEGLRAGSYPGADVVHDRGFYVGLSPFVEDAAMDRLIDCLDAFLGRY